jgi:hypothetical protein
VGGLDIHRAICGDPDGCGVVDGCDCSGTGGGLMPALFVVAAVILGVEGHPVLAFLALFGAMVTDW